jgi:cytochrome oxidase Cu insertion factor (SCO1/SenC/PrrC family)
MFINKKFLFVWLTTAALCGAACATVAHAAEGLFPSATVMAAPQQPTKLPDFELPNLNGGTLKSADMKGKVIIIRFWATW